MNYLAPTGTKFDYMWFTGIAPKLVLYDGNFRIVYADPRTGNLNQSPSIVGDPSSTVAAKHDIPVLDTVPSAFRILAPHQDVYFVGNRPFFFMNGDRTFMVTSIGSSIEMPDLTGWVDGNVVTSWRADYFPRAVPVAPNGNGAHINEKTKVATPIKVLAPGPGGRRFEIDTPPISLKPDFQPFTLIPRFVTSRQYRFTTFFYPFVCDFEQILNRRGISGLLSLETQEMSYEYFSAMYTPEARVLQEYPVDKVEFSLPNAFGIFSWELFFRIVALIASRLIDDQKYDEALWWLRLIFDPTGAVGGDVPQRYWRTLPFHKRLSSDYETESVKTIEKMIAEGASGELKAAVERLRNDPYDPCEVVMHRSTALQKYIVMQFIQALIARGDQSFRKGTLEANYEAAQYYDLANEILGPRPEVIERNIRPAVRTFNTLHVKPSGLPNALEQIELLISDAGTPDTSGDTSPIPDPPSSSILYFCVPENQKLLDYWDTVEDRLYKLRHCMNIEGQVEHLPLFPPEISPELLIRAQAAGLSIGDVLNDISVSLPNYRFSVMIQQATLMADRVQKFGSDLLAALERRDAEAISLLRSGQELQLLEAMHDIRQKQIDEAKANITALEKSKQLAQTRKDFYGGREFINIFELLSLSLSLESIIPIAASANLRGLAAVLSAIGNAKIGPPTTAGYELGAEYIAKSLEQQAIGIDAVVSIMSLLSQNAGRIGEFTRRRDEWGLQTSLADTELKQIDQQLTAANFRLEIAEQELRNHELQTDNARAIDQLMREKFTNQELIQWQIEQISAVYFQSYQLAYSLAKKAEQCFRFELGLEANDNNYINFGYWDSLKRGLLAGEKLHYDLRRLEVAYLEQNLRKYELTKNFSLLMKNPLALVQLRETGRCVFTLDEEDFDADHVGHLNRRIASIDLTMPCVVGPYTSIPCTLRLLKNSIRINTEDGNDGYPRNTDDQGLPIDDSRFIENIIPVSAIATSRAQNDGGVFELSFRDERYLPFEGAGVISQWSLELFHDDSNPDFGKALRQFDYNTISDVILRVNYTAQEGPAAFKKEAVDHLREYLSQDGVTPPSLRMFNLRQEFPTQWYRFLNPANPADGNVFDIDMSTDLFNYRDHDKTLKINRITLLARCTNGASYAVVLSPPLSAGSDTFTLTQVPEFGGLYFAQTPDGADLGIEIASTGLPTKWRLKMTRPGGGNLQEDVEDLLLILSYQWES